MNQKPHRDYQTVSLFVILGILTVAIVFLLKVVLFNPSLLVEMASKF